MTSSSIKKTIEKLDEMTSGAVAPVAMPLGGQQRRVEEDGDGHPDTPANFGLWKNSVLSGKKQRGRHGQGKMTVKLTDGEMYPQLPKKSKVAESSNDFAQELLAMAKKITPGARLRGSPEEERERTRSEFERRDQEAKKRRDDLAKLDSQQLEKLEDEVKRLQSEIDSLSNERPEYADREQNLTPREREARDKLPDMRKKLKDLQDRIDRAQSKGSLSESQPVDLETFLDGRIQESWDTLMGRITESGTGDPPNFESMTRKEKLAAVGMTEKDAEGMTDEDLLELYNNKDITEGSVLKSIKKSIKRGLQGWGGAQSTPDEIVKRNKAYDTDTAKKVRLGLDDAPQHSPAGLQKRVLDRKLKKVAEATLETDPVTGDEYTEKFKGSNMWHRRSGDVDTGEYYRKVDGKWVKVRPQGNKQDRTSTAMAEDNNPEDMTEMKLEGRNYNVQFTIVNGKKWVTDIRDGSRSVALSDNYDDLKKEAQAKLDNLGEGKTGPGLWANIRAKQKRIKGGSGERMRKPGSPGAPSQKNLLAARRGSKD